MLSKIGAILSSVRFWQLAAIAGIQVALGVGLLDGTTAEAWANGITLLLGGSVTIGTLDSVASRING